MGKSKIRKPAVAGQFYPSLPGQLQAQIESFIDKKAQKLEAIACMLPHAGYTYSGSVAGKTVSRIKVKDKVILLGPNHTGFGSAFSIMTEGVWQTPLGAVKIDSTLAQAIIKHSEYLEDDELAHLQEHSLEVELPFLQYFKADFEIVPITLATQDINILKSIGADIAFALENLGLKASTLIVASSDMTHYESKASAQKKDQVAISAILELDEEKLMRVVSEFNISMCGFAPAVVMLSAAKLLGARSAELIQYQTSGDVTGDNAQVVGYAGIVVH